MNPEIDHDITNHNKVIRDIIVNLETAKRHIMPDNILAKEIINNQIYKLIKLIK